MRKILLIGALLFGLCSVVEAADGHTYIGVKKCSMCHKSEKKGNQYGQWLETKHAKAFEVLGTPAAAEVAKERGISGSPQEADQCLKCHIAGHGVDEALLESSFKKEDGVQCESCHGAGGEYKSIKIMKDREQAITAGLMIPDESVCVKCHNEESPNFSGFNFEEYFEKIKHPNPAK